MDELLTLKPKLTRLKLSGVSETLEHRISQAMREKWSFSQFLEVLLSDEVERRDFKQLGRRLTRSGLEPDKTFETFDFRFNPRIHEPTLRELATCQFITKHENAFFVGPSRVGKSHLQIRCNGSQNRPTRARSGRDEKNVFAGGPTAHVPHGGWHPAYPSGRGRISTEIRRRGLPTSSIRSGLECPAAAFGDNHFHWRRTKRKEATAVDEQHLMSKD